MAGVVLGGTYTSIVRLTDPGTQNPATVTVTGVLMPGGGTALYGVPGTGWTIDNAGSIVAVAGFGIVLAGGGALGNTGLVSGTYAGLYVPAGAVTVTNAGTMLSADHAAVNGRGGGTLTNLAGAMLSGFASGVYFGAPGTVVNSGSIGAGGSTAAGVRLSAGGFVTNAAGGMISTEGFGIYAQSVTVANDGEIAGTREPGIVLRGGGSVTNGAGARIAGHYSGVRIEDAAGTVVNAGAITSDGSGIVLAAGGGARIAAGGQVRAGGGNGVVLGQAGGVTNQGTITATENGVLLAAAGATVDNTGSIQGYAAVAANGAATVTNGGTLFGSGNFGVRLNAGGALTNAAGGLVVSGSVGLGVFGGAGTVDNAGLIAGSGTALRLANGFANRLVLRPGGQIIGVADGGNGPAAAVASVLELGAGVGTLAGLGTSFVNFGQVAVDAGGEWMLAGANTVTAPMTVAGAGTLAVAGALLNRGSITAEIALQGGTLANGGGIAGVSGNGGTVTNFIGGTIAGASAGILLAGAGSIVNAGTISGADAGISLPQGAVLNLPGALVAGEVGVSVPGSLGVLVNNLGTISGSGGTAVSLGWGDDRVLVHHGAVFQGIVDAALGSDTLELAADGGGALRGLGTDFQAFETLVVQPGVAWRLPGPSALPDGGTLAIGAGARLAVPGTLRAAGSLSLPRLGELAVGPGGAVVLGGGKATDGAVTVGVGKTLSGIGRIRGDIIDRGTVLATGGGLRIVGDVSGPGTIAIDAGAVMAVTGALGARHVTFLPGGGTLQLGTPAAATSRIAGFGAGDTIDLAGIGLATSVSLAGDVLTVHEPGGGSLTLTFAGTHAESRFVLGDDGSGGTLLTYH